MAKKIPEGWRLAVVGPDGDVEGTVDIGGYDLSKQMARVVVANDVLDIINRVPGFAEEEEE